MSTQIGEDTLLSEGARDIPDSTRGAVFSTIFERRGWGGRESVSGTGSDRATTEHLRALLPGLLMDLGVETMVDAPCGDFHWLNALGSRPWKRYIGADIVPTLIERDIALYQDDATSFILADITQQILPKADLILCRDCLVHLPYADIFRAISNFIMSGSHRLLTTTFPTRPANRDIAIGDWRPLNLQKAPFHLPKPDALLVEMCPEFDYAYIDKSLAIWDLQSPAMAKFVITY